jgi:transposase-like protein
MKRHTSEEIGAKLRLARDLVAQGQSQSEICKKLGVSVMTFHRWRKQEPVSAVSARRNDNSGGNKAVVARSTFSLPPEKPQKFEELRLENERLKRIVANLLIEKSKIEEILDQNQRAQRQRAEK